MQSNRGSNRHAWHLGVTSIVSEMIKGVCAPANLKNTDYI